MTEHNAHAGEEMDTDNQVLEKFEAIRRALKNSETRPLLPDTQTLDVDLKDPSPVPNVKIIDETENP